MIVLPKLEAWKKTLEEHREQRHAELIAALETEGGNISRATKLMDPPMSRQRVTILMKELDLIEFARELREGSRR